MVQKCILQVEDEETDVLLLRHAFKKADIANPLFVASDGAEAIFREKAGLPTVQNTPCQAWSSWI
jgi:hypothetical protein